MKTFIRHFLTEDALQLGWDFKGSITEFLQKHWNDDRVVFSIYSLVDVTFKDLELLLSNQEVTWAVREFAEHVASHHAAHEDQSLLVSVHSGSIDYLTAAKAKRFLSELELHPKEE